MGITQSFMKVIRTCFFNSKGSPREEKRSLEFGGSILFPGETSNRYQSSLLRGNDIYSIKLEKNGENEPGMARLKLKELYEKGEYQKILDQLARLEENGGMEDLSLEEKVDSDYYKSRALVGLGQNKEALQAARQAREKLPQGEKIHDIMLVVAEMYARYQLGELDEGLETGKEGESSIKSLTVTEHEEAIEWIALFSNVKGNFYLSKGELDEALDYYQRSLTLKEKTGNPGNIAGSLNNIGIIYSIKGELDEALDYYQRSLKLYEKTGNPIAIADSLNNIGNIYSDKGELDEALDYYQRSLKIQEKTGNPRDIAGSLNNIGNIYSIKGELDKALDYYQWSLKIQEKTGNPIDIAGSLNNIGNIYHAKGDLDTALGNHLRALTLQEAVGNDLWTSETLLSLVHLTLDSKEPDQARKHLSHLRELQKRTPEKKILLNYRLADALVLKQGGRMRDKTRAQIILEELVSEEIIDHALSALAMTHLCELLLEELKLYGEPEVMTEAKNLVNRLYKLAQEQCSFTLVVRTLLLKMKFATIEGELQQALKYLDQALITAEEKNLGLLVDRVKQEQRQLEEEYDNWQELILRNAPFSERIEQAKLEECLAETERFSPFTFSY